MNEIWTAVAGLFDLLSTLGALVPGLAALALGAGSVAAAWGLQRRLVHLLSASPQTPVSWWRLERQLTLPGLLWQPFVLLYRKLLGLVTALRRKLHRETQPASAAPPADGKAPEPLLVATLGPSFLLGALITAGLYGLTRLLEPLLRIRLALTAGVSPWQLVLFGHRPEMGPHLPLDGSPYLAALLALLFWMAVAAWASRTVRFVLRERLGRNLIQEREAQDVLPFWRRQAGAVDLFRPDGSYTAWASWVVAWGFPLLVWAWLSLNGSPWRVAPGEFAVAFVLWLSWAIHLLLRGVRQLPAAEDASLAKGGAQANGWPELLAHLRERLQVAEPYPFQAPRAVEPLQLSTIPPELEGVLSPLVLELLPGERRLTMMQRMVLTDLALQGFVHVEPPVAWETLELSDRAAEGVQDRSGLRHRNQIVIAPEASGRTTLALLAAANHALVHTRGTLVIARDEEHETEIYERFRTAIEPSTVRWNVRVRRVGGDLVNDLTLGIVPDVIVCSLQGLVVHLLGQTESFAPFLQGLGLIVMDDVELFEGPVEVHAQLAFRRLTSRVRQLVGVQELGERSAPLVLVLGGSSMHDLGAWARALCGIDAVVRDFTHSQADQEEREAAELAARGFEARPSEARQAEEENRREITEGHHQVFYRLRDFRTAADEPVGIGDLIAACEHLAIPWCYRPCGDGRRRLGRLPLRLRDEPKHCVDAPESACVVFLEGRWSEVWRERQRLRRAGARFSRWREQGGSPAGPAPAQPEPIAMITLVDPDEDMAFTQLDRRFGLAEILDGLPEPVLRPPTGDVVQSHLAADLVQHWLEVAEVLGVFGHATAHTLRRLSRGGMLLLDRRTDVHPDAYEHVQKVYVRALARATAPLVEGADGTSLLPSRVSQVELVSARAVTLRDRTRPSLDLGQVDAAAASFLYYPGRIFTDARGSFVVVGLATDETEEDGMLVEEGDILVEPLLTDEVSSPRRRIRATASAAARARVEGQTILPEAVLFGRLPFDVGLLALEVRVDHVATYRLAPATCEVRQRLLRSASRSGARSDATPLLTRGLVLVPNPEPAAGDAPAGQPRHPLRFDEGRLLAAAMRAVLPSMYRGGAEGLEVGLLVEGKPEAEHELTAEEGFLLFEVADGGNGMAQAVHRDGLETLLRLCRLLIERVLHPDRLLALHDHWGDEDEILASSDLPSEITGRDAKQRARDTWDRSQELRQGTLTWLDQHLRPEGRAEGSAEGLTAPGSGSQPGEGDAIDIGRCWSSHDGTVTDLIWAKHRWRLPAGNEAMLDVGFDRATLAAARLFTENGDLLAGYAMWHAGYLQRSEHRLPDGTVWGAPREVWLPVANGTRAERARDGAGHPAVPGYHVMAEAIAAHGWPVLGQLAETLGQRSEWSPGSTAGRLELARYLTRFVQGIPYSVPGAVTGGLRPPVSLLLYRLGDCDSKSLLIALLALHCGIDAGLFVSFAEGHAMAALALPEPGDAQPSGDEDSRPVPSTLDAWSSLAGLPRLPRLWAEMPASPEAGAPVQIYVPVESTVYSPVGGVPMGQPGTWAFLPLTASRFGTPSDDSRSILREDRVEWESR